MINKFAKALDFIFLFTALGLFAYGAMITILTDNYSEATAWMVFGIGFYHFIPKLSEDGK